MQATYEREGRPATVTLQVKLQETIYGISCLPVNPHAKKIARWFGGAIPTEVIGDLRELGFRVEILDEKTGVYKLPKGPR